MLFCFVVKFLYFCFVFFFFSSRRRHTRSLRDWSSDVCSSDLLSAETFKARRNHAPMTRRPRTPAEQIARLFIFGLRWFPPGRKAPERTMPPAQIDRASAEAHFLAALEAWDQVDRALLPERRADLFVKHPRMGDLTIEEWMRFHVIHARHHARQIRQRVGQ